MLEGAVLLCGIDLSSIQSGSEECTDAKLAAVKGMAVDPMMKLCQEHGFAVMAEAGTGIVIPPNFLLVESALNREDVHGFRWSLWGGKQQQETSLALLEEYVAKHPKTSPTHKHFVQLLTSRLSVHK